MPVTCPVPLGFTLAEIEKVSGVNEAVIVLASVMFTVVEAEVNSAIPCPDQPLK